MTKKVIDNGVRFTQMYYISYLWILPKKNYSITKRYNYWTDWHIVKPRFLRRGNVTRCSNNNHGLNSAKDSSAGL